MVPSSHAEKHFTASAALRDVVIGMADGLTVPFALAAGLTGALAATHLVVTAGVAEIAAGAIAMGLGGYMAACGEADHYASERVREQREVHELAAYEEEEVIDILGCYGIRRTECAPLLEAFHRDPEHWVDFMMRFELGLEKPNPGRAWRSALTIGGAYVVGGLVPLLPYMLTERMMPALLFSALATTMALAVFGAVKGRFSGSGSLRGAWQTVLVGGLASIAAFMLARLVSGGFA